MKSKLCLLMLMMLGVLFGCASNGYVVPSTGASAQFSVESLYDGDTSKFVNLTPFTSIFSEANSCKDPQVLSKKQEEGIKITALSLVTISAGFRVHYPNVNRGSTRQAIFSFTPKESGNYKLLIDYDQAGSSVSLKLMNLDSGSIESIKQRKVGLNARGAAYSIAGCQNNYAETQYSKQIYSKDHVYNPTPVYSYTRGEEADYAILETSIKTFELLPLGLSVNGLTIYDDSDNCDSYKKLSNDSGEKLKFKVPTNQELILLDTRFRIGNFCSVLFAFSPEVGKSYSVNSKAGLSCEIEVVDVASKEQVLIHRKRIDRSADVAKCVDLLDDGNKRKYQKSLEYHYR